MNIDLSAESVGLESTVDRLGLAKTLELLSEICAGKAEHIQGNWQDIAAARSWSKASNELDTLSGRLKRFDPIQLAK